MINPGESFDPQSITRPDEALMRYYLMVAAMTVVGFPFVILPLMFKYRTLQYRFDDKGVSMSWGMFFKREIYLTYRRIQDIHVTRNLFHRWLGLAALSVQTASGSAGAEMTIEGIRNPEALRDFLYAKMRGAHDDSGATHAEAADGAESAAPASTHDNESLELLQGILREVQQLRAAMERKS